MKKVLLLALAMIFTTCTLLTPVFAADKEKKTPVPIVTVAPATETQINGVPESQIIHPMITVGPIYEDYVQSSGYHIDFFKIIGSSYVDNRKNTRDFDLTYTITQSQQQGSEWNVSVTLTAEGKLGILAKAGASIQGGLKETRSTNEAVGVSGHMIVPKGMEGRLEAYYGGQATSGTYKYYYDTDGNITHYTTPLNATVYKNYLDVNFKPITW